MLHYSNHGALPHVVMEVQAAQALLGGDRGLAGNVNLSFSTSLCACLVFENGRLEKVPSSILRELSDLGQFTESCLPPEGLDLGSGETVQHCNRLETPHQFKVLCSELTNRFIQIIPPEYLMVSLTCLPVLSSSFS